MLNRPAKAWSMAIYTNVNDEAMFIESKRFDRLAEMISARYELEDNQDAYMAGIAVDDMGQEVFIPMSTTINFKPTITFDDEKEVPDWMKQIADLYIEYIRGK